MRKIGFDIGGVLSKYPIIFLAMMATLEASPDWEVYVLTDMPHDKAVAMLRMNGINIPDSRVHSCDYDAHGEGCKAVKAAELGLDMLIDDFGAYVSVPGKPMVRLLVMPDPGLPYYADGWEMTATDGKFGRCKYVP